MLFNLLMLFCLILVGGSILGVASAIESFNGNNYSSFGFTWSVQRSTGLPNTIPSAGNVGLTQTAYTYAASGAKTYNQASSFTLTIAASGTNNLLLAAPASQLDVMGGSAPTFSAIRFLLIELLDTTQGGGANAATITIGNAASQKWVGGILTGSNVLTIPTGGRLQVEDPDSAGAMVVALGTSDTLKILNDSSTLAASVRVTIVGYK
jgi:hypothetical protein